MASVRVLGIDPGTVSLDICGLEDGRPFLDLTLPTADALQDPQLLLELLRSAGPLDLVAGPSGYGLPLVPAAEATEEDLRLAVLAPAESSGGIGGLRAVMQALAQAPVPVVFTPGVIHLPAVPPWRKCNRVDMGTADKVCAAVLAIHEQMQARRCPPEDVSLVLVEMGGAFSAVVAVDDGRIVDGVGGSAGPMGAAAAGALDGEVAFLLGTITKGTLFGGGARTIAGTDGTEWLHLQTPAAALARDAYLDSLVKAVAAMLVAVPAPREIVLSGRLSDAGPLRDPLLQRLHALRPQADVHPLGRLSPGVKHAAYGAALVADGLAGGQCAPLVNRLDLRAAAGSVLDHLHVISRQAARIRLGLT